MKELVSLRNKLLKIVSLDDAELFRDVISKLFGIMIIVRFNNNLGRTCINKNDHILHFHEEDRKHGLITLFVLLHEVGHMFDQNRTELLTDTWAIQQMIKLGFKRSSIVRALESYDFGDSGDDVHMMAIHRKSILKKYVYKY